MTHTLSTSSAAALAAASIALIGPASAQPSDTGEAGYSFEEIMVTAQKRSEGVNDIPLSIQAFTGDALQNAGIFDASQLTLVTPGLNFSRSSANTPIYTLRGVGFNTPNLSSTSPVGVYVDEVAYAYPFMSSGPLFDLERVEVLKGPQGTLYGRNTTGGLFNFITKKPSDTLEAGVIGEIGNFETYNFEAYVSGPVSETVGVRLSGRWENSDKGWQNSVTRDDELGKKDRLGLRAIVDFEPNEDLRIEVSGSYWRDRSDTVAPQAVLLNADQPDFVGPDIAGFIRDDWTSRTADWDPEDGSKPPFEVDAEFFSVTGRIDYAITEAISLVSLTAYNDVRRDDTNDVDGTPVEVFAQQSIGDIASFSQELRLVGSAGQFDYIVGAYYSRDKINDNQVGFYERSSVLQLLRFLSQNAIDPMNALYTPEQYAAGFRTYRNTTEQTNRSASIFASGDWEISDQFKVSAGLRYTDDQLRFSACSGDFNGNTLPIWNTAVHFLVNAQTGNTPNFLVQENGCMTYAENFTDLAAFERPALNEDNVAGRLSLQYTPNDDVLLYGTFSRGFKSGAVPMLPTNNETQLEPARQERVTAYELGSKLTLLDGRMQLNSSAFYYDYRDKQLFSEVLDPVFTTLTRLVNVPKSEVYGFEVDGTFRATQELTLRIGAALTKTNVKEFQGFNRAGQPEDFAGQRFPYTPEWQVNGSINYDTPITTTLNLQGTLNANYLSETSGSFGEEPGFGVDAYTIVNGTVSVYAPDNGWRVGLYANNIFDTYYWTATDVLTDIVFRVPGMARTFGVRVSYDFQ
ncbi:MAG: TonB-dependent receptor [Pseudomonadota bacterium]